MGVLPGVSDLVFLWGEQADAVGADGLLEKAVRLRALFLELKRPGGALTTEQSVFGLVVLTMSADFAVAKSIDEAVAAVQSRGLLRRDRKIESAAMRGSHV
jgi:hypothetical protein